MHMALIERLEHAFHRGVYIRLSLVVVCLIPLLFGGCGGVLGSNPQASGSPSARFNDQQPKRPPPAFSVDSFPEADPGSVVSSRPETVARSDQSPAPGVATPFGTTALPTSQADLVGPQLWHGTDVSWHVPNDWRQTMGSGVRFATLTPLGIDGCQVAITRFAGDGGGPLKNVNRWRREVGLPPIIESELQDYITQFTGDTVSGALIDVAGTGAAPSRSVIISLPAAGETWFFKLSGPAAQVAMQVDTLKQVARSVRFGAVP
jgi:hypothetical protein